MKRAAQEKHLLKRRAKTRNEWLGLVNLNPGDKEAQLGRYRKHHRLGCPSSNCMCKKEKYYEKDIPEKKSDEDFREQLGEI